jgi:hypothetical protein
MKNLLYLFCSFLVALTACEPLDSVFEELDEKPDPKRRMTLTMSVANYEFLKGKPNVPSYVNTNFYFISEKQAGNLIPLVLNNSFGHLNDGDAMDVTYNTSSPSVVTERLAYTVTDADYALGGSRFTNFDAMSQIEAFLNVKYPTPLEGRLVTLTYTWYNGLTDPTSRTVTETFYYGAGKWFKTTMLTAADYLSVDRNRYNAFSLGDETSLIPGAIDRIFKNRIVGAKPGDVQYATYLVRYSSSSTLQEVMPLIYNGINWVKTYPTTLAFVKRNGVWVADPILRYTLTAGDYTWISQQPNLGTALNRDNLERFKSFYQRFTDNTSYWTRSQLEEALGALLDYRFPDAPETQKYEVTYILHTGPTGPASMVLQKINGKFIVPKS